MRQPPGVAAELIGATVELATFVLSSESVISMTSEASHSNRTFLGFLAVFLKRRGETSTTSSDMLLLRRSLLVTGGVAAALLAAGPGECVIGDAPRPPWSCHCYLHNYYKRELLYKKSIKYIFCRHAERDRKRNFISLLTCVSPPCPHLGVLPLDY